MTEKFVDWDKKPKLEQTKVPSSFNKDVGKSLKYCYDFLKASISLERNKLGPRAFLALNILTVNLERQTTRCTMPVFHVLPFTDDVL